MCVCVCVYTFMHIHPSLSTPFRSLSKMYIQYVCTPLCLSTGLRRLIGCLKLQVIFRKRVTNYRAVLQKITSRNKASYDSTPPCTRLSTLCIDDNIFLRGKSDGNGDGRTTFPQVRVCICICMYTCTHTCIPTPTFGAHAVTCIAQTYCVCLSMGVCLCLCVCVCLRACLCMRAHTHKHYPTTLVQGGEDP